MLHCAGLIVAVKPNTLKSTQRAFRRPIFTAAVEPNKTVITTVIYVVTSMNYSTRYEYFLRFEVYVFIIEL